MSLVSDDDESTTFLGQKVEGGACEEVMIVAQS
jgi:hypothetical protein